MGICSVEGIDVYLKSLHALSFNALINRILRIVCTISFLWIIYVFFCFVFVMPRFICALWSPAGKGLTSWLSFVVSN